MNKNTHVYCTECVHGDKLIQSIIKDSKNLCPKECNECYPYNPEDSFKFEGRPNYIASTSLNINKQKFYQLFKSKLITEDEIDDYIDKWHDGNSTEEIYEFLGMTQTEYRLWVQNGIL